MTDTLKNKKLHREEPEFTVQKEYEGEFKKDFYATLVMISKSVLQKLTNEKKNVVKQ